MNNNLTVPISIVIAGLIIAGAIFYTTANDSGSQPAAAGAADGSGEAATAEIDIRPVTEEDWILGDPEAPVKIVEYSDPECPFCKRFHGTLHDVVDNYGRDGKVAWVYRHFPIAQLHSKAETESLAFECAGQIGGNQKFWAYADRIMEITPSNDGLDLDRLPEVAAEVGVDRAAFESCMENKEYEDEVQSDYDDAQAAGGRGTPHSVMILPEPASDETRSAINDLLSNPQIPNDLIKISEDETRIAMSGALPYEMIDSILKTVTE